MTQEQFINNYKYLRLNFEVIDNHVKLINAPLEMSEALKQLPDIEERMLSHWDKKQKIKIQEATRILREALHNPDALDAIKERAAIRWSNGLSDSLFNAVLCNLKPLNENAERDSKGNIILKPQTDWEAELRKFEA